MAAFRRLFIATALGAFATVGLFGGIAHASTPPLGWAGGKRLHLLRNVAGGPGIDQAGVLFGTAPRAVAIKNKAIGGPAVAAAIKLELAETLPWRAPPLVRPVE